MSKTITAFTPDRRATTKSKGNKLLSPPAGDTKSFKLDGSKEKNNSDAMTDQDWDRVKSVLTRILMT